ncbi:carbohydrate binding family 9 domain-containing protein [Aurantibacter crassamenti]|uniref:DUF5916 domain-containing protein n=1 Tax=Aurantibacter crassamenti TaxID=1837375 RepID=UPI00193A309B|nr:DUF5916 domain-containing protein [Aurantibacter crassamenti]MBM1105869.1 carbohydrate binding family 9 domain-containing protein [Aurantibacter crassamenti]
MRFLILILFVFLGRNVFSQDTNVILEDGNPLQIHLQKKSDNIVLDGILNEDTWLKAEKNSQFSQYFPTDSIPAIGDTEIYMSYDESHFYIAAKCYSTGNNFRIESLKRDFSFARNDNINFIFDTYNDNTNAYQFSINAIGVQKEGLISSGGKSSDALDNSWDNKWAGNAKMYDDYWICELAIPFSTIRYKEGTTKWRFNSYRNDAQTNETSCFINIPRENNLMNLNYMADIVWDKPLADPGKNLSFIPYMIAGGLRDFEDVDETGYKSEFNIGGDVKIGLSSSLNLDLTVNPDFSQVEIDQQVTNLDRFEISLPEKRQFFLENADLFSEFGNGNARPFFSRRIGISIDTLTENNIQNTIYGGARLSGKLNKNLRIGMLTMQTAAQQSNDFPSFNYTVLAAEQKVFDRSNIGFIFISKQAFDTKGFSGSVDNYDRVAGLEYRLHSKDNFWTGKASYMKAFTPNDKEMKYNLAGEIEYNRRRYRLELATTTVGDGFDAEVGFVPRRDYFLVSPEIDIRFFPKTDKIAQMTFKSDARLIYKLGKDDNPIIQDFGHEETRLEFGWEIAFQNNHKLELGYESEDYTLLRDFDPTRIQEDNIFFSAGTQQYNSLVSLSYDSDVRKTFSYSLEPSIGKFYGGDRRGVIGGLTYRYQPYGSLSLEFNYTHLDVGGNFKKADLWLVGPRVDFTFSKKLFWTTYVQYNNRLDNLNVNSRLQWRFAPVSDFFIVYTDNYLTEHLSNFSSRNRALLAKITFWLNK